MTLMGNWKANVGEQLDANNKGARGRFGLGVRNSRGERLTDFAIDNDLVLTNTLFKQHPRRLFTWTSPDGETRIQIDYMLVKRRHWSTVQNTRMFPGADCGTDHQLLCMDMRLKATL